MSNRARALIVGWAGVAYALCALPDWHDDAAVRRGVGIVAAALILWIAEIAPAGIVGLGIPIAATLSGVLTWSEAVAAWGDPIIFLFLGAFLLTRALDKHGAFDRLSRARWAARGNGTAAGMCLPILGASGLLSTVQNNTAVTAMLLPIVASLARRTRAPALPLLALAWGSTFGGMATPVGTAPNFIGFAAMKKLGADNVTFVSWLAIGLPVWLGTTLIGWVVLSAAQRVLARAAVRRPFQLPGPRWLDDYVVTGVAPLPAGSRTTDPPAAPPWTARRWAVAAMLVTAAVWLACGLITGLRGPQSAAAVWVRTYLPESLVPIAMAALLFTIRTGTTRQAVLDRHDLQTIDWDTLFLIAGGLCLGRTLEASGVARELAAAVGGASANPWLMCFLLAGVTVLLSELTSNTATASLMVPIAAALGPAVGLGPIAAVWLVALSASLGFVLPISTPPNALVYGTRLVPLRQMAVTGVIVDALSAAWVVLCVRLLA